MVPSVVLTPDGRRAVSASRDTLRVWDLESGACLRTLEGHSERVYSVAGTPDGRRAVSANGGKTLRVWDLESGACLIVCSVDGPVTFVAPASQVPRVVAGVDKEVRFFDLLGLPTN